MSKGTYSFTTPIYYVNAAPHLGTAYTTIAADTVARYQRMNGYDVAFVTGMDEHGQKVADTAAAKGMTPQDWCDSMEPAFRDAWDMLGITYTDFVAHHRAAPREERAEVLAGALRQGLVLQGQLRGLVLRARGDVLRRERPREERRGAAALCPDCKRPVQKAGGEENWFFKLSEFGDKLLEFYEENPDFIRPETRQERDRVVREERPEGPLHLAQHLRLGRAAAVRRGPRGLRVGRRAAGVPHGHRLRRRGRARRRVRCPLAHAVPLRGQGHHALPLRHLAGHAHGGRDAHHPHRVWPRLPAHQGREDVEVEGQRPQAGGPLPRVRRGRVPLLLHERRAVRRRRLHLPGAHGAGVQRRPGQHLGQPLQPRVQHDEEVFRRPGTRGAGVRRRARGGQPAA